MHVSSVASAGFSNVASVPGISTVAIVLLIITTVKCNPKLKQI